MVDTIGIYCRVSSESQRDNYSLDTQRIDGEKWCKDNNYRSEVFIDVISGTTTKRKGFDSLQNKLYSGELKGIYVRDFNRIIRGSEVEYLFTKLVDITKCMVIENGRIIDFNSLTDNNYFLFKSMFGKMNRNEIKFLTKRGIIESLKRGSVRGDKKFGYDKKDKKPIINESESKIVKDIFKSFLHKNVTSMKPFVLKMNEKHNSNFSDVNFSRILKYEGYVGMITQKYEEFSIQTKIPQIIDKETFERVQLKLESWKKKRKGRDKYDYLLKGMVYCGSCGGKMYKRGSKNKNGLYHFYYICKNYGSKGYKNHYISDEEWELNSCKSYKGNGVSFELIDELVWEFLFKFINDSDTIKEEYKRKFITNKLEVHKIQSKERYYKKKIDTVKKKKFDTYNQHLEGKLSLENFNQFDEMFDTQIEEITNRMLSLTDIELQFDDSEIMSDFIDFMKTEINNLYMISNKNFKERKEIMDKYIDSVEIVRKSESEYLIN